ncbi:MAG: hypothetical protein AAF809_06000 [Bacteroidota bacterium]
MESRRQHLLNEIARFEPIDGNWLHLDTLLIELFTEGEVGPREQNAVFYLFERYPEDDGAGVLWTALHGLENAGRYAPLLVASVRRMPSLMSLTMVRRLLNSGIQEVEGQVLYALLEEVSGSATVSEEMRQEAKSLL